MKKGYGEAAKVQSTLESFQPDAKHNASYKTISSSGHLVQAHFGPRLMIFQNPQPSFRLARLHHVLRPRIVAPSNQPEAGRQRIIGRGADSSTDMEEGADGTY